MRNHVLMAALGAAFLCAGCGDGGNMMPPPPDCSLSGELVEGCSELRLTSTPGGAAILIDGEALGATPTSPGETLNWRGPFGTVTVEATLDGYEPYLEDVLLGSGRAVDHNAVLVPTVSAMGMLAVSIPPGITGATLLLDGIEVGTMPMAPLEVPEGPHRVTVTAAGYVAAEPTVDVVRMETTMVTVAVGRDLTGRWTCDRDPRTRMITMSTLSVEQVEAYGFHSFTLLVSGNMLSSGDSRVTVTGSVSPDGREVQYDSVGGVSFHTVCTR